MRASQWFLATQKEIPHDAELVSHQLMLRAGMIRKLGAGLYTWLPLGLRVLRKVEKIIREEMNATGAVEVLMPAVQPAELWEETGRWKNFGNQLLKIVDNNKREYCFGPTHEEVITDLVRQEIRSYKQLPVNFYQIQTKFRDEIRPRFGVMRAREFIMKDAYSFHLTSASLQKTYNDMYQAYCNIIERLGLRYRAVEADTGAIGGSASHEFQVLADAGEDLIFYSEQSNYAANVEQATSLTPSIGNFNADLDLEKVTTPSQKTIAEVASFLKIPTQTIVKTLVVTGTEHPLVALILRGDDELNIIKAQKHPLVKSPLNFVTEREISEHLHVEAGFLGPVNLNIPTIVDHNALALNSFVCGANENGMHFINAAWQRDARFNEAWDLRMVREGDLSPDGQGQLKSCRGIEVGHVFQLGKKYSEAMGARVLNEQGNLETMLMGCYGFGVSRVIAAAIEQNHDQRGIIWPRAIAPFALSLIPINAHQSSAVKETAEKIYQELLSQNIEVLLDDRAERPGVLFADHDLIGIPHRLVISERLLINEQFEYKARNSEQAELIALSNVLPFILSKLQ